MEIAGRPVGRGHPCLIIAEAGVNHNGDLGRALEMIDRAAEAGADAVKFQSFFADEIVTRSAPKAGYQRQTTDEGESQYEMLRSLELDEAQQAALVEACARRGILFLSTPYDLRSVALLERLGVSAYKIASTDTTNLPFLRAVGRTGRPVLLSTGMCDLGEVEAAVRACRAEGDAGLALLHCTSEYPAPLAEANLRAIGTLERAFGCPVGFSDHTPGIEAGPWAVAAGACVLEKHFTLDRSLPGPDHAASLEPGELAAAVRAVRALEAALGDGIKRVMPSEAANKPAMQKSLVARRAIAAGETITAESLACKRPATGLPPAFWERVIGRPAARDIAADETLTLGSVRFE